MTREEEVVPHIVIISPRTENSTLVKSLIVPLSSDFRSVPVTFLRAPKSPVEALGYVHRFDPGHQIL